MSRTLSIADLFRSGHKAHDRKASIRVLWSVRQPGFDANPFVTSLAASVESGAKVVYFSWPDALLGKYDLVHLHWPEDLFRARRKTVRALKYVLFILLAARLKMCHTPVIWTVHNNAPHEGVSRFESMLLKVCMSLVTKRVFMTAAQRKMFGDTEQDLVIRHGHYRESYPSANAERRHGEGSFLYFGFVRRYKGVEKLLESFSSLPTSLGQYQLTIAGRPNPAEYGQELISEYGEISNVQWLLDFQSKERTSELFAEADVVVLPYKKMINSGALLLGLSLGKPVLAPRNTVTEEIQQEVGLQWLHLYEGEVTGTDLLKALRCSHNNSIELKPDLSLREWKLIGAEYLTSYSSLSSRKGIL